MICNRCGTALTGGKDTFGDFGGETLCASCYHLAQEVTRALKYNVEGEGELIEQWCGPLYDPEEEGEGLDYARH